VASTSATLPEAMLVVFKAPMNGDRDHRQQQKQLTRDDDAELCFGAEGQRSTAVAQRRVCFAAAVMRVSEHSISATRPVVFERDMMEAQDFR